MLENLPEETRQYIQRKLQAGDYPSEVALMSDAIKLMQEKEAEFWALVKEGYDQAERGEVIPYTPELMDEIFQEAMEDFENGASISDAVKP
jgi:Arc/MetJ-type ribon-helix-helix transcriptional regulator